MSVTVLNDQHLGVTRRAGTTAESAKAMSGKILSEFRKNILASRTDCVVLLGDLFDSYQVSNSVVADVFSTVSTWAVNNPGSELLLVRGNHDYSNDTSKLSSFDLLSQVLVSTFNNCTSVTEPTPLSKISAVIIPHMANQAQFDAAVEECADKSITLFSHCNYENNFTDSSDHSLNLTKKQAAKFKNVILAHEHKCREIDNVTCVGVQCPSSISDCLHQTENFKWVDGELINILESEYTEVDWHDITSEISKNNSDFIRVIGNADSTQQGEVISATAKLRKASNAFIVSNAVDIAGVDLADGIEGNIETLSTINPVSLIKSRLKKKHQTMLEDAGL